jgi:hypothetical protein
MKEDYEKMSNEGAIFFLTSRGRLIEGIDFNDH